MRRRPVPASVLRPEWVADDLGPIPDEAFLVSAASDLLGDKMCKVCYAGFLHDTQRLVHLSMLGWLPEQIAAYEAMFLEAERLGLVDVRTVR